VASRAEAEVALAQGDSEAAVAAAREGLAHAERADLPIDGARCRILIGRALAADDPAGAVVELRRAHTDLAAHGATRYSDQTAAELRKLGRVAPRGPTGPPNGTWTELSNRERQVAALVAEGRTNREIAQQLVLSEKTIANHLSRIFRRLDLGSRAELAAVVARRQDV
jgi:DNA-binding NarL/FixJ family response regulator